MAKFEVTMKILAWVSNTTRVEADSVSDAVRQVDEADFTKMDWTDWREENDLECGCVVRVCNLDGSIEIEVDEMSEYLEPWRTQELYALSLVDDLDELQREWDERVAAEVA